MRRIVSSDLFKSAYKLLFEFEGQVGKMRNEREYLHQSQLILGLGQLIIFGPLASFSLSLFFCLNPGLTLLPFIPPFCSLSLHSITFPIYFNFPWCVYTTFILTIIFTFLSSAYNTQCIPIYLLVLEKKTYQNKIDLYKLSLIPHLWSGILTISVNFPSVQYSDYINFPNWLADCPVSLLVQPISNQWYMTSAWHCF